MLCPPLFVKWLEYGVDGALREIGIDPPEKFREYVKDHGVMKEILRTRELPLPE